MTAKTKQQQHAPSSPGLIGRSPLRTSRDGKTTTTHDNNGSSKTTAHRRCSPRTSKTQAKTEDKTRTRTRTNGTTVDPAMVTSLACPFSPYGRDRRRQRSSAAAAAAEVVASLNLNGSASSFSTADTPMTLPPPIKEVRFFDRVHIRKFLPDWADPRNRALMDNNTEQQEEQQQQQEEEKQQEEQEVVEELSVAQQLSEQRQWDFAYLRLMRNSKDPTRWVTLVEDEWSPRGLETQWDMDATYQRRKNKLQACLSVLLLQARNQSEEEISRHLSSITHTSHSKAHRQGLWDELDAQHGLGASVLSALKQRNDAKAQHAIQLKRTLHELKYHHNAVFAAQFGNVSSTSSSGRETQRFARIFTV